MDNIVEFDSLFFDNELEESEEIKRISKYSTKTSIPQYEPTEYCPSFSEMVDTSKYEDLVKEINASSLNDAEKRFLRLAASRHIVFNYSKVADYYANSSKEIQTLLEHSAMVIIDVDNALANGFIRMDSRILDLIAQSKKERDSKEI